MNLNLNIINNLNLIKIMETLKHYCIKRKSAVGQQIEQIYDYENDQWVKELTYCEPSFSLSHEKAFELLKRLKSEFRGKWMKLYAITG